MMQNAGTNTQITESKLHKQDAQKPLGPYYLYLFGSTGLPPLERLERFYKIDQLLRSHRIVPRDMFIDTLEVSLATFKRDLEYLRDRFHAPIEYDRDLNGYQYTVGTDFVLPGLWMSASEIHALLTMRHLLSNLQPGILEDHVSPLMDRIQALLETGDVSVDAVTQRIRILTMATRPVDSQYFEMISNAVLTRKRLKIEYYSRAADKASAREISPQRLVHYRDNWYLDAWCHAREGLRCFTVESITQLSVLETDAIDVNEALLEQELGSGFVYFPAPRWIPSRYGLIPSRLVGSRGRNGILSKTDSLMRMVRIRFHFLIVMIVN